MLYYKEEGGRTVFSTCNGMTMQEITSAGWQTYIPEIPHYPRMEPEYYEMREAVEKIQSSIGDISDDEAIEVAALFPTWASNIGKQVTVGERLWYDGKLYKVIQPHTVQQEWTPDITPALYVEVSIEEWPEIPEVITAENAFMIGDRGTWKGQHYICKMDNCVWNPDQLPSAWELA